MANRQTRLITKNSAIVNRPLPTSLLTGEAIVNTADGIVLYSGVTTSTNEWTPAGVGSAANFFEVGSNLYDLRLRNRITKYEGQSGVNLVGKFLSGTTNGFVLADISNIAGVDSYVTGATWNPNILTLKLNNSKPNVTVTINAFTALTAGNLTVTGTTALSGSAYYYGTVGGSNPNEIINLSYLTGFSKTNDVYVTGSTLTSANNNTNTQQSTLSYHGVPIGGTYFIDTENTFTTGGTYDNITTLITFDRNDGSNYTVDLSSIDVNDTYVTGYTYNPATNTLTIYQNQGEAPISAVISSMSGLTINGDLTVTGNTYLGPTTATTIDASTIYSGGTNLLSIINNSDTFVTGFTYNPANNTLTITRNQGEPALNAQISSVTGLTISTLAANRVVYTTGSGKLTTEAGFEYSQSANTLTVGNINVQNASGTTANIGQGGLVIGSGGSLITPGIGNLTVHGNFTVFGTTTTVATSELYVEDPQITLNYSTGSTTVTSVSSGVKIQDGNGIANGDVYFTIGQMQNLTGLTPTEIPNVSEYTALTGYANRGWVTQLHDIVIRNTNKNEGSPNGVRVLTEFDTLDGGTF
jgi:hypothetical protein